ncbi:protein Tri1p [Trichomonascus vanleenenianus]|uniref:protein Tri1p n=1 Tax=Trichomonascus vanleenenianus TaxID=2268995 RepID=UPI003ECA7167
MQFKGDQYIPTIDAILGVSDLEKISARKLRRAIQELFGVDLTEYKKPMDDLIMDRFVKFQERLTTYNEDRIKEEQMRHDAMMAAQLQSTLNKREPRTNSRKRQTRTPDDSGDAAKKKRKAPTGGFNKPLRLSPELVDLVGEPILSRPQVVKRLWVYIKEHKLQNPADGREILCDERMQKIFGAKVSSFGMNALLKDHLTAIPPEEMPATTNDEPNDDDA